MLNTSVKNNKELLIGVCLIGSSDVLLDGLMPVSGVRLTRSLILILMKTNTGLILNKTGNKLIDSLFTA